MLVGMISFGVMNTGFSFDKKDAKSLEGNRLKNRKEYRDMKNTMSRIEDDKARIALHKKELKENKEAELAIEAHMSKKELRKAKADLKRDKKYLKTDRKDLKADQRVAIKEAKKVEKECAKDLRLAKRELRKDIRQENTAEIESSAQRVEYLLSVKDELNNETASLEQDVDDFFAYLDDEIETTIS